MSITGSLFFFSFFVFYFFINTHHYSNHNSNIFKLFNIVFCFKKTLFEIFLFLSFHEEQVSVFFHSCPFSHVGHFRGKRSASDMFQLPAGNTSRLGEGSRKHMGNQFIRVKLIKLLDAHFAQIYLHTSFVLEGGRFRTT